MGKRLCVLSVCVCGGGVAVYGPDNQLNSLPAFRHFFGVKGEQPLSHCKQ